MRQFPAEKWENKPIDLFDCRFRSWYFNAVNYPKDIVIMIDGSGSMNGTTSQIATKLTYHILDTLGPNDYVNVYIFRNELAESVVPCFSDILVQVWFSFLGFKLLHFNEI